MRRTEATDYSRYHIRTALIMTAAAGALLSCSDSMAPDKSGTFFGPTVPMADGSARAYVTFDRSGAPTELGVALTEAALTGLPAAAAEFVFTLPAEASATPFRHAVINWMPTGHPPPYDGALIFGEPMVAKAYLETKPAAVVTPVKLPAQYARRGYQATSYTVAYDAGTKEYKIALSGLVAR